MSQTYYTITDNLRTKDIKELGLTGKIPIVIMGSGCYLPGTDRKKRVMAKPIGERRAPKAGEWYLSGGPATVWRAPNDLNMIFDIMQLVVVAETTTITHTETPV